MDSIHISGLELDCIVGLRPPERRKPQRVRLAVELALDLRRAATTERIAHTVDYSVVADEITNLLKFREYRLVETATEEIAAMLLGLHPSVERATVTLEKPEALRGLAASGAVRISRERRPLASTPRSFGDETVVLETAEAALSLYSLAPGQSLAELEHSPGRRLGWLVSGQLEGVPLHEPRELPRILTVKNQGAERATVFLCRITGLAERRGPG